MRRVAQVSRRPFMHCMIAAQLKNNVLVPKKMSNDTTIFMRMRKVAHNQTMTPKYRLEFPAPSF